MADGEKERSLRGEENDSKRAQLCSVSKFVLKRGESGLPYLRLILENSKERRDELKRDKKERSRCRGGTRGRMLPTSTYRTLKGAEGDDIPSFIRFIPSSIACHVILDADETGHGTSR
jgi:hypothetical protein